MTNCFTDDKLNRKIVAEYFKNILLHTDLNVFSVTASWGGGKTYFIENLVKMLADDSVNIIYNAWESDFYESPLIPLLLELLNSVEKYDTKMELEKDIIWAKDIAKTICEKTSLDFKIGVPFTKCAVNFDSQKKTSESEYMEIKNKIADFKRKLQIIQEKIDKKIFIFIDELDRCHPLYTIKTLEIIKHFFGIPNIIFVLAIDKKQIENSVRTIFGVNQGEENGYLRKFIDVEFQLPTPNMEPFIDYQLSSICYKIDNFINTKKYYNYYSQSELDAYGIARGIDKEKEAQILKKMLMEIFSLFEFTLRDIEKYFIRFNLILDSLKEKDVLLIEPCFVLNALAMRNLIDFDNYIKLNSEGITVNVNKLLPLWRGLFYRSYKQECNNLHYKDTVKMNTLESNVRVLHQFLFNVGIRTLDEQEQYLQNYPLIVKFINNFTSMD